MFELKIQEIKKNSVKLSKTQYLNPKNIEAAWADRGMQIETSPGMAVSFADVT